MTTAHLSRIRHPCTSDGDNHNVTVQQKKTLWHASALKNACHRAFAVVGQLVAQYARGRLAVRGLLTASLDWGQFEYLVGGLGHFRTMRHDDDAMLFVVMPRPEECP